MELRIENCLLARPKHKSTFFNYLRDLTQNPKTRLLFPPSLLFFEGSLPLDKSNMNIASNKQDLKSNVSFYIALIGSIWFLLTSAIWIYLACLVISYPFGILAFALWIKGKNKDEEKKRYRIVGIILATGLVISLAVLVGLLITN